MEIISFSLANQSTQYTDSFCFGFFLVLLSVLGDLILFLKYLIILMVSK